MKYKPGLLLQDVKCGCIVRVVGNATPPFAIDIVVIKRGCCRHIKNKTYHLWPRTLGRFKTIPKIKAVLYT